MDLSILLDGKRLNIRTSVIIQRGDEWLMHYGIHDSFITTVGGRIKVFEDSKTALIRELKEELNLTVKAESLEFKTIVEGFFDYKDTPFHELLFVYYMQVNDELGEGEIFHQPNDKFVFKFYTKEELKREKVMPPILKAIILSESVPMHYISNELKIKKD